MDTYAANVGSNEQQIAIVRILAHDVNEIDAVSQIVPRSSGRSDQRVETYRCGLKSSAVSVEGDVHNCSIKMSRVEPSHFDTAIVYVTFDGHRDNNFKPHLYVSTDFGRTFRSIVNNLPANGVDFIHVVREDPYNRDLLFVGTDVAAYVSTNRGSTWQRFMTGLPTVPVHDLRIHPRDREIIAGTHGRSIWIADIAPLEQLADSITRQPAYFFEPVTAYQYATGFAQRWEGNRPFVARNSTFRCVARLSTHIRR